jgi:hypothetical protein
MKLAVISALLAVMFITGSAWADEASAVKAITDFGLARKSGETGSTITIVNASENPLRKDLSSLTEDEWADKWGDEWEDEWLLNLGDITGITIDWKANLTIIGELNPVYGDSIHVILFENGAFKLTGGTIDAQTTGIGGANVIVPLGDSTVTVDGGAVKGTGESMGIFAEYVGAKVIVERGEVNYPNGYAILAHDLIVNDPSVITGMTFVKDGSDVDLSADIYGNTYTEPPFSPFDEYSTFVFTVKNGATWTVKPTAFNHDFSRPIEIKLLTEGNGKLIISGDGTMDIRGTLTYEGDGELTFSSGSSLNIHGTLTNKGRFTNRGTIRNYSKNTLNNAGTLTNRGTIENTADGQITNTGTIDNASGKIINNGTIENNSGTIKSDAANFSGNVPVGNPVEPIDSDDDDPDDNGNGGGCNAGFGMFGLLFAGLAILKHRKI